MDENRRLGAEVLARKVIQLAFDVALAPRRGAGYGDDSMLVPGETFGRAIGLALFVGARAEGFNPHAILRGLGQALGEYLEEAGCPADRLRSTPLEVMVEDLERGVAEALGLQFEERPHCPKCWPGRGRQD